MRSQFAWGWLLLLILPAGSLGYEISSYALVQDNASLRMRGKTIHLYGIYVPPTRRFCRSTIRPTRCAGRAALALDFKIGANFVRCSPKYKNPDRSLTAVCSVKGEDLGAYLLTQGMGARTSLCALRVPCPRADRQPPESGCVGLQRRCHNAPSPLRSDHGPTLGLNVTIPHIVLWQIDMVR